MAPTFITNVNHFVEQAHLLVNQSPAPVRWLVVDAGAITDLDFSAGRALIDLQQDLAKQGVVLALTRVSTSLREDLDRQEVTGVIGAGRIFSSRKHCLAAYRDADSCKISTP